MLHRDSSPKERLQEKVFNWSPGFPFLVREASLNSTLSGVNVLNHRST